MCLSFWESNFRVVLGMGVSKGRVVLVKDSTSGLLVMCFDLRAGFLDFSGETP